MIASRRSPCAVPAGFAIEIDADGWLALAEDDDRTTGEPGVGGGGAEWHGSLPESVNV